MKKYYKNMEDGYITAIGTGPGGEQITQEEYDGILAVIHDRPTDEPGYTHRLKADLTWEQVATPVIPEEDTEATEADYLVALSELGVTMDEEA